MAIALSREQLSTMLKDQLEQYNVNHPEDKMDAEKLAQRAEHFFYRKSHPDRYIILWKQLEPELQDEPCFIKGIRDSYKPGKRQNTKVNIGSVKEYLAQYLGWNCQMSQECEDSLIQDPNELFYMVANACELDCSDIARVFNEFNELDAFKFYTYFIYDLVEYYFAKSGLSEEELSSRIPVNGFRTSTIYNLLNRSNDITYKQFLILAEALKIPENWTYIVKHDLLLAENQISFKIGYDAFVSNFMGNPDKIVTSLYSWEDIETTKIYGAISKLYRQMGYVLLSEVFPEQTDFHDPNDMENKFLEIISPDHSSHMISLAEYEAIKEKILKFARYRMDSELE